MLEHGSSIDMQANGDLPRHCVVCDKFLVGLVLLTLVRTGDALAGEQFAFPVDAPKPDFGTAHPTMPLSTSMAAIPAPYLPLPVQETRTFSSRDFRPREPSLLDAEPRVSPWDDAPLIRETPVWQRLSEFRSRNRIRVLTLWEAGGSSISLQAGRKGDPSLQWTSRLMNHGGATHGVLDRIFSTSLAGAGRGLHLSPRTSGIEPAIKPARLPDSGGSGK